MLFRSLSYCEKDGKFAWKFKSFAKPRPIFGINELIYKPKANVLVVEGEKTALAARILFPKAAVISWPGGSKAYKFVDWTLLGERKVYLWPDADEPGVAAMRGIAEVLSHSMAQVWLVNPPTGKPEGWDLADAFNENVPVSELIELLKSAEPIAADRSEAIDYPVDNHKPDGEQQQSLSVPAVAEPPDEPIEPFKILGHEDGLYYYLRKSTQGIHSLSPSAHTKLELIEIGRAHV